MDASNITSELEELGAININWVTNPDVGGRFGIGVSFFAHGKRRHFASLVPHGIPIEGGKLAVLEWARSEFGRNWNRHMAVQSNVP